MVRRVLPLVAFLAVSVSAQPSSPVTIPGRGDTVSDAFDLHAGLVMIGAAQKSTSNFIVHLEGPDRSHLVVNALGDYQGVRLLPVPAGRYRLSVKSAQAWVLMRDQPRSDAAGNALPVTHAAAVDTPLGPFTMKPGLLLADLAYSGTGNYIVSVYRSDGQLVGLLANKLGAYSGQASLRIRDAGTYWIATQAAGPWTMTAKQD